MESATVKIRPLRLAFLVKPSDKAALKLVFEINSGLWGGLYNFIIPYFTKLPKFYHMPYIKKQLPATAVINGMLDGIQPDYLVETNPGMAAGLRFPSARVVPINELMKREKGRTVYGVDMRTLCQALWDKRFQFEQRKPPTVIIPRTKTAKYELLFRCLFGDYSNEGDVSDFIKHYHDALGGEVKEFEPGKFPLAYDPRIIFPLRLTVHELKRQPRRWWADPKLFFFDENNGYDLIDYWNMRAAGWQVRALPVSLAPELIWYVNSFLSDNAKRSRNPNSRPHACIVCARSQTHQDLQAYISTLTIPENHAVVQDHVPNLWEESSRIALDADPCLVTHATKAVRVAVIGNGLHIYSALPDFLEEDYTASERNACANVIDSVPGGAAVIPWQQNLASLLDNFGEEKTFVSRDGIVFPAGEYSMSRYLRVPTPINVFTALAEGLGYDLSASPAGQTAQQIIKALGSLALGSIILKSQELLKYLNRLAHEDVEVDVTNEDGDRRVKKAFAPYNDLKRILNRAVVPDHMSVEAKLSNLVRLKILRPGLTRRCPECGHTSWYELSAIASLFTCPRCSHVFPFPTSAPPAIGDWGYKVTGPFAAENYAHGSYCVIAAMNLLCHDEQRKATWITSFEMVRKDEKTRKFEADFSMFIEPTIAVRSASPAFVLGECKSFNRFEDQDFKRARHAMQLFPGAALCFATFRENLTPREIQRLRALANAGREYIRTGHTGHQRNPVIILTGKELFGQFKLGDFYSEYGKPEHWVRRVFEEVDLEALGDFTQQEYLGMKPFHEAIQAKYIKKEQREQAAKEKRRPVGPDD
jgi:hypothetical protein